MLRAVGSSVGVLGPGGAQAPSVLIQSAIPFLYPSSGSFANNGALSGLTSLDATLFTNSPKCYMYFPAAAIAAGSTAGWYYSTLLSATTATVFNNPYTIGQPEIPSSPTSFSTTGPGAYTQTTAAQILGPNISLAANTMGVNGRLEYVYSTVNNNTAGSKQYQPKFGSAITFVTATTQQFNFTGGHWQNTGLTNNQTHTPNGQSDYGTSNSFLQTTIDTTTAQNVGYYFDLVSAATDYMALYDYVIKVYPAN